MLGTLYVVATPIGNLEDITFRAIKILKDVDLILAEDTRKTNILLKHYDIKKGLLSYRQQSFFPKRDFILNELIKGKNIALVTDGGTPGVSDPGGELINYIVEKAIDIKIIPIPGPSSLTAAMSISGFRLNNFIFVGFLPKRGNMKLFDWVRDSGVSLGFFESPYRIIKTLDKLYNVFEPDRRIFVARELTKIYETLYRGTISQVKDQMAKENVKGEIVVIIESVLGGN